MRCESTIGRFHVAKHDWTAAPGEFAILVGSSFAQINLQGRYLLAPGQGNVTDQ
jgi:hypothetical protein